MKRPTSSRSPRPNAAASPAPRILAITLGLLLLARAVAAALPHGWAWGIGTWRFLPVAMSAGGALLLALALVPPLGRAIAARLGRDDEPLSPALGVALALALALLAGAMPDRMHYTGDSDKRQASFVAADDARKLFPQALPADLALHHDFPRWLESRLHVKPEVTTRLFGVAEAAAMGVAGWLFARALGLGGAAGFAAATALSFGGWLALFGGYLKPFCEFAPLVGFMAAGLVGVARRGRGLGMLGLATAAGVLLHRVGLALLSGFVTGWIVALTVRRGETPWRSAWPWIGLAAVLGATAATVPHAFALTGFDVERNLAPPVVREHGAVAAALSVVRLADLANLFLMLAPLAVVIPFLLGPLARRRRVELIALAGLALPQLGLAAIIHPQEGMFRGWDLFTAAGVALAAIAAVLVAEAVAGESRRAWLAIAVAASAAVPAIQWEWLQADVPHGLSRVEAIVQGPPARDSDIRARSFDWAGMRRLGLGQASAATESFRRAAELAPNPRYFVQWGMAETMAGDVAAARDRYAQAVALDSLQVLGWKGLAATSSALGDAPGVMRAVVWLRRLAPADPVTKNAEAWLANRPQR